MDASGLTDDDLALEAGSVSSEVREEFPELGLVSVTVAARPGRTPRPIKQRLRDLSDRFRGSQAVTMRQDPIPWAYRVFYRQVGIDPDARRTPMEEAAVQRLLKGAFKSRNLLDDALTIALIETGVPLWALDADKIEGELSIRQAEPGERLGRGEEEPTPLPDGRLVVADAVGPVAVLFGGLAPGHGVVDSTVRMTLFSVQVAGVPAIHVEEAFWTCVEVLAAGE